jgi:hypothetical protein
MKLDNYSFSGFQGCPLWYKTRIVDGWAPPHKSAALGFGGAVHVGLAEWYRSRNPDAVMEKMLEAWPENHPVDDYRDMMKAKKVLLEYMQKYIHESFTIVPGMIEIATALPTGMYLPICPECGYNNVEGVNDWYRTHGKCSNCGADLELIEYGGIFDTLVDFAGQIYILEHKTTSQLGPRFFDQFKPNNQVTGYVWMAQQLSGRCDGAIVNAIGVFKVGATRFERHITTRNQWEINDWLNDLWVEACTLQRYTLTGQWPKRSKSCTLYGACEFLSVHQINDPSAQARLLEQDYIHDPWEFEKRDV